MDWGSVIGGIGIGSILASCVTHYLAAKDNQKKRIFDKKETAYIGLLEAICASDIMQNKENAKKAGYWHARAMLVGSPESVRTDLQIDLRRIN